MDKNEALKIMDGLKAIQNYCDEFDSCSECELQSHGRCILQKLFDATPSYWNVDEVIEEIQNEIELEEETTDGEPLPNHRHEATHSDMIHHPGHYNFRGMECKDFIEKFVADPKSYYEGNIFKYLYRYLEKNKEEDLNKAMEYTRLLKEYLYGKNGKEE